MDVFLLDFQALPHKSGMVFTFSDIDPVQGYVGPYDENRPLMPAYRQALALPYGKELGAFVLSRHAGVGMGLVPGLFDVLFARAVGFGLEMQVAVVQSCSEGLELGSL